MFGAVKQSECIGIPGIVRFWWRWREGRDGWESGEDLWWRDTPELSRRGLRFTPQEFALFVRILVWQGGGDGTAKAQRPLRARRELGVK